MGGHSKDCFTHAPLVVISPGIPPSNPTLQELKMSGLEIISEVEFAYRENQKHRKLPVVGITGTNGKTTTTTLISRILTEAGHRALACGNIGVPVTQIVDEDQADILVIELSSFQLEFSQSLKAKVAVLMNFTPDHLDWHGSLEAYERAKLKLFTGNQSPEWSVSLADDPITKKIVQGTTGRVLGFSRNPEHVKDFANKASLNTDGHVILTRESQPPQILFNVSQLQIIGTHNHENVLAAVSACHLMGVSAEVITNACLSFPGVEHRLEKVAVLPKEKHQIAFYNDSKATNVDAALSALRAFGDQKVILIAGGKDKNTPLEPFVEEVHKSVAQVILLGEAKERFAEALKASNFEKIHFVGSLEEAVQQGYQLSQGEPVLFSPACASFDMFKNFEDRGRAFKEIVINLPVNSSEKSPTPEIMSGSGAL
jgi:UDP-N-acetylmuramoylalanine--D-glutamate ligase